jgi:hypothetical protein
MATLPVGGGTPPATNTPPPAGQLGVGAQVGAALQAAQELAKQKKYQEALAKVAEADAVPNKTPYEVMTIEKFRVFLYLQLNDYGRAASALEAELATGIVPEADAKIARRELAILYFRADNNTKGIEAAKAYLNQYGPDTELLGIVAQQAYLAKDFATAGDAAEKAVRAAEAAGVRPDEVLFKIWLVAELNLKNSTGYTTALETLVSYYPKPDYWHDLLINLESSAGFASRLKLDVNVLRLTIGTMKTAGECEEIAQFALTQNYPAYAKAAIEAGYKAKLLSEGSAKDKQLLATATSRAAAEKVTANDEADARGQKSGESLVRLGAVVASYGNYAHAIQLDKEGIAKGGVTQPQDAKLHLGVAQILNGDKAAGQNTLSGVTASGGVAELAKYWTMYSRQ